VTPWQQPAGDPHKPHPEKREGCRGAGEARAESTSPGKAWWEIQQLQPWHKVLDDSQANTEGEEGFGILPDSITQTTTAYPPFLRGS